MRRTTKDACKAVNAPCPFGLVIHGGAGGNDPALAPEGEHAYGAKLTEAIEAGFSVLARGGAATEAVVESIRVMEDCGMFNAGRGAAFNADGLCELDASIMDGRTQEAGAVAGLRHIKNPISLARDVMLRSPHVMLFGDGAERFARRLGYELVPNEYFQVEKRRRQWERSKRPDQAAEGESGHGTVGCAALDRNGNLAAGTSTGGTPNKTWGRVGDSPIIGAGTYANNATCAVSATGTGEFFIRGVASHDVSARMQYGATSLDDAVQATLAGVKRLGGEGGIVAIDREGRVVLRFNSPRMYRGYRLSDGRGAVATRD